MFLTWRQFLPAALFEIPSICAPSYKKPNARSLRLGSCGIKKPLRMAPRSPSLRASFLTQAVRNAGVGSIALRDLYTQALPKCSACYS